MSSVTFVVVNHKTLHYVDTCVRSLQRQYPKVPLILVDNGSQDASAERIRSLGESSPYVSSILNEQNLTHGPALHQGTMAAKTPYVFTLDSDCEVRSGGFLALMLRLFEEDPLLYAAGQKVLVNAAGVTQTRGDPAEVRYCIRPYAMLFSREKYLQLPPFRRQGSPTIANAWAAVARGWKLADFPVRRFIWHRGRGTEDALWIRWDGQSRPERSRA